MSTTPPDRNAAGDAAPAAVPEELHVPRTRISTAWVGAAIGAVLVLLMLVFILQNGRRVRMHFLWADFTMPLGAGLLLAAVVGALAVILLGAGRLLQLRLTARRHRKADRRAGVTSGQAPSTPPAQPAEPAPARPAGRDRG